MGRQRHEASLLIWVDDLIRDIRYAARSFRRAPGFTAITLITVALGVGANTTMFSILYGTCLAPLPYSDPSRLVDISMVQRTDHNRLAGTLLFGSALLRS